MKAWMTKKKTATVGNNKKTIQTKSNKVKKDKKLTDNAIINRDAQEQLFTQIARCPPPTSTRHSFFYVL